jgi:hypothetical protein
MESPLTLPEYLIQQMYIKFNALEFERIKPVMKQFMILILVGCCISVSAQTTSPDDKGVTITLSENQHSVAMNGDHVTINPVQFEGTVNLAIQDDLKNVSWKTGSLGKDFQKLWEPVGDGYTYYYKEYDQIWGGVQIGYINTPTGRCKSTSGTIYNCSAGM